MILLNPGPVRLTPRVRAALGRPDLCHREPEFAALQEEIRARLLDVYDLDRDAWCPILLGGSGSSAVEAMLGSLIPRDGRLLVLANGVYGERMAAMAHALGIECSLLRFAWGEPIAFADVALRLARMSAPVHVAVVHHETTTGRLNELDGLARICAAQGAQLLIDAVSSFGAERLDLDTASVAAVASTAGKCLHGAPGASFVIARRASLAHGAAPPRSIALDLAAHARAQDAGGTAFTPPVPLFHALCEALREHARAGGWPERHARLAALAAQVQLGLARLGIRSRMHPRECSVALRSYALPEGMHYELLHDELKKRGFVIYAAQAWLQERWFRVSTLGDLEASDIECFLRAVEEILQPDRGGLPCVAVC
jgi:2-aminoethylphosphonate-pyruvate transaminase